MPAPNIGHAGIEPPTGPGPLTARRVLIIRYLAYGKRPRDIGKILGIATDSVYEHLGESRKLLNVRTNCELIRIIVQLGLIEPVPSHEKAQPDGTFDQRQS